MQPWVEPAEENLKMAQELIYTSFPKGVKPGVSGFCTVAVSPDMAPNLISRLEGLSGYRQLFRPGTPEADLNPPNWSHVVINVGNTESHVIYRVADAGLDYTGRSNKLAHFIVLDKNDQAPCGPAAMLTTPGLIDLTFDQQVGTRAFTRQIPRQLVSPRPCLAWRQATGDPGWAGELAQTAWTGKYACIVYRPGMNVLALVQEAMALLPPERRWKTTFSTYYSKLPTGIDCQWRCVAAGTPEAAQAIAEVGAGLVIDLSNGALAPAAESPAVAAARAGRMVLAPAGVKAGVTAARQRPVQTSRPAADAALNAGIENELQAIDSAAANDLDDELLSAMDSMPEFILNARKKKTSQAAAGKKFGLYAAILALVFLIGIAVATYCVVTTGSLQNNTVAVNQTNLDDDDEDETTDETTDETDDEQFGLIPELDQNAVNDPNSDPAPVTEPAPVSDQNQQQEGNSVNGSDKGESQPDQQNANTDQKAANVQSEADVPKAEPNADSKQLNEENKNAEPAKQKDEPEKPQQDDEGKIFDDERWVGADPNQFFIYVDSNDSADCSRLNYQLKNKKLQISKLELVSLYSADSSNTDGYKYTLEYNQEFSCYIIKDNGVDDESIKIRISEDSQGESNASELKKFSIISIEGDRGIAFQDFVKQDQILLATFADKSTKIITFFRKEADVNLKNALTLATFENSFKTAIYTFQTNGFAEGFSISNLKLGCFGESVFFNKKEHKIVSKPTPKKNSSYEIRIEFNEPLRKPEGGMGAPPNKASKNKPASADRSKAAPVGSLKKVDTMKNIVIAFEKDSNIKILKVKYAFDLESKRGGGEPTGIDAIVRDYYSGLPTFKKEFLQKVRACGSNLPLYIDVYLVGDAFAENALHEPFLWKRLVLPPPEGASK